MAAEAAINGFVLAGGKSRRMGQDKALMQLGGRQLVVRAADVLRPFVNQVAVLAPAGRYRLVDTPLIPDRWPNRGPLAAMCPALLSSTADWNIFLACDLPFVSEQFIRLLIQRVRMTCADAVVPRTVDGWQPLSGAYHARCRTAWARALDSEERSIIKTFDSLMVEAITSQELASAGVAQIELANVNTPEDWARLSEWAERER